MRKNTIQWWKLLDKAIIGFDEQGGAASGGQGTGEGEQGSGQGQAGAQGEGTPPAGQSQQGEDVTGLKSALEKERNDRKLLEKELKEFRTAKQAKEDADKTEVQRLTDYQTTLTERYTKLANGYRDSAIRDAVIKAATEAKFLDPSDALRAEVLSNLPVEQDEDDPTRVTIDLTELGKRVKKLGTDKPHYLAQAPRGAGKSGSTFGGSTGGNNQGSEQAALQSKYPALRGL
jgi:hypothetical protein